jgi:branched-chain amino acid aminotransferase
MVNLNGVLTSASGNSLAANRAFLYGDGIFETVKILDGKVLFLEDHYFRLMSGMRIIRMEIPMDFTMEYFETQLLETAKANDCLVSGRARMTVYRNSGGYYLPSDNHIGYIVQANPVANALYPLAKTPYEVDLFKDFYVTAQLLSTIKSTNRLINITGTIFAEENGLDNCLLLNDSKDVIEGLQGNLFMLSEGKLITPPVSDGCLSGIMRKQVLVIARKIENVEVIEASISPFDLQKADELFLTNVMVGIQPITKYRKKEYATAFAQSLLVKLNAQLRLG